MSAVVIGPEIKVGDLLDAYPEAEEVLIGIAPQFKALKNPVLRRTVARVATVEQAARVAGMSARELVRALRSALGADCGMLEDGPDSAEGSDDAPVWVRVDQEATIDAGALLDAGQTPIAIASKAISEMETGDVLVVAAPFQPAPLIDSLRGKGHEVYARAEEAGSWRVWVRKG
jgi:TusA-related sulfurtransferase